PEATIIESKLVKSRGAEASAIVTRGTLSTGSILVAGKTWCKVRSMTDEHGAPVKHATPGHPVLITGWKDLPIVGSVALGVPSEAKAKAVIEFRHRNAYNIATLQAADQFNKSRALQLVDSSNSNSNSTSNSNLLPLKAPKILSLLIRTDVSGTLEALVNALSLLPQTKVKIDFVHTAVGAVTDNDVQLAATCPNPIIIAYGVKPEKSSVAQKAKNVNVPILANKIIYHLIDQVKAHMLTMLDPVYEQKPCGEATVLQVFQIGNPNNRTVIAGCRVTSGVIEKSKPVNIIPSLNSSSSSSSTTPSHKSLSISSLKQLKKDIEKAANGVECGIGLNDFTDFNVGDTIQSYELVKVEQTLD
ncbi:Translation initiation factor IF-2, partial [Zancudomyces culisetae]